jgi:hypothetical protein
MEIRAKIIIINVRITVLLVFIHTIVLVARLKAASEASRGQGLLSNMWKL